jgi:transcriptional regulator with XRE-family HTH domain
MSIFSKRLHSLLDEKNITQKELAMKTQITPATISRYITDQRKPSAENANTIANTLDVSVDYLLGRIDNPNTKIIDAVNDDPELKEFTKQMLERESLQLLFKQTKDMDDRDIRQILKIIKAIEDEEDAEDN